jgi:hypothetical protein
MPKLRNVLSKVYDLCKARGFVFERSFNYLAEENSTALDYGPLGIEIKRSLFNEWWHEIVTSRENVYGIDLASPVLCKKTILRETDSTRFEHFSSYLLDTYNYSVKLMEIHGRDSPAAGLAQSFTMLQRGNGNNDKFMFRYVPICQAHTDNQVYFSYCVKRFDCHECINSRKPPTTRPPPPLLPNTHNIQL